MRKVGALVIAALVAAGTAAPAAHAAGETSSQLEADFLARINSLRASQGVPALQLHPELVAKARSWAATMGASGTIFHSNVSDGISADWKTLAENVGMGGSVETIHAAFVASPTHYGNLVKPEFQYVGVGVFVDGAGTIFVAEEFMSLQASTASPVPAPPAADSTPSPSSAAGGSGATTTTSGSGGSAGTQSAPVTATPAPAPPPLEGSDRLEVVLRRLRDLDG